MRAARAGSGHLASHGLAVAGGLLGLARTLAPPLLVWQVAVWLFRPPRYILPSPLEVGGVFQYMAAFLARNALVTVTETVIGFVLGLAFGAAVAIGAAAWPVIGRLVWPLLLVVQALPVFAIAPLLVVWFGFGLASKVIMATIVIFFPVASAFGDGLRRTDPTLLDAAALTPATHWQTIVYLRMPLALPALISGLRVAAPLAPLGAIVGEWVGASSGLGFVMVQANARMQTDTVFAAMVLVAVLSLLMRGLVDRFAPRLVPWAAEP